MKLAPSPLILHISIALRSSTTFSVILIQYNAIPLVVTFGLN